jgi:hypothetical protein
LPALFVALATGKAFTDMVKTGAAGGEMHNCFVGSVARLRRI